MKTAISKLHDAIQTDKTDHAQLVAAMKNYQVALQQAIAAGDSSAVQTAITGAQNAMTTLRQAEADQVAANAGQKTAVRANQQGHMSNAVNAITAVTARDTAKGTAMLAAANSLNGVTSTLTGGTSSSSTVTNTVTDNSTLLGTD